MARANIFLHNEMNEKPLDLLRKSKFENGRSILCLTGWPGNPSELGPSTPAPRSLSDPRPSCQGQWNTSLNLLCTNTHTPTLHIHHIWSNGSALFPISDKLHYTSEGFKHFEMLHSSLDLLYKSHISCLINDFYS